MDIASVVLSTLLSLLILAVLIAIYFIPAIVASSFGHCSSTAIFVVNLFLGWTFLGWIIALVWALTDGRSVEVKAAVNAKAQYAQWKRWKEIEDIKTKERENSNGPC